MSAEIALIRAELERLRSQVDAEAQARARDALSVPVPLTYDVRPVERSGFHVHRYGAGGFDKVIVTAGKVITRAGVSNYAQQTFTFTDAGELFARYEIATGSGGAAWEEASAHVIQQAASLPDHAAGFVLIPIASIGWNATDSRISTVTVHHTGTLKHIELPAGILAPWNGSIATIPAGWAHATALNDMFLVGAGTTYAVDATGGETSHDHTLDIPKGHTHPSIEVQSGTGIDVMLHHGACDEGVDANATYCEDTEPGETHWTITGETSTLPPYLAKAWMIKL